ncbi:response regulator transcription factor [Streptomyces sp. NPDC006430]|uniref:response regulator transcription factor n=1 Tax=Streptomyces sp. NPDC006430 TaxID=3154299 RepID=UPI0033B0BC89
MSEQQQQLRDRPESMHVTEIRIVLVVEDVFARGGISAILNGEPAFRTVGETGSLREAATLASRLQPDLFVVDSPVMAADGIEMVRRLRGRGHTMVCPVLLLADGGSALGAEALRLGACSVLRRRTAPDELVAAVRLVAAGYLPIEGALVERLAETMTSISVGLEGAGFGHGLTKREREVFELMVEGMSNAEIAVTLSVASSTVKSHVQDILGKLGLRNRLQAVIYAYRSAISAGSVGELPLSRPAEPPGHGCFAGIAVGEFEER